MAIHLSGPPGGGTPGGVPDGPSVPLFDLAPGGVCRADRVTPVAGALLPHRFTLTCALPEGIAIGGLFSVALSCRSPRLAVNQHPALWSPDLPRLVPDGRGHPPPGRSAATRPAHRRAHGPTPGAPGARRGPIRPNPPVRSQGGSILAPCPSNHAPHASWPSTAARTRSPSPSSTTRSIGPCERPFPVGSGSPVRSGR